MPGVIEIAANGWEDDRTNVGHIRTKPIRGSVVAVPFRDGGYNALDSVGSGSGVGFQQGLISDNEAGYNTACNFVANGVGFGFGARMTHQFKGNIYGIYFQKSNGHILDQLSVVIDGEAFKIKVYQDWLTSRALNLNDSYSYAMVAEDIPDLPDPTQSHVAEIVLSSNDSGAATFRIFGYIVDGNVGYTPPYRSLTPFTQTLTDAAVQISIGSGIAMGRTVRKICYFNSHTAAVLVTMQYAGTTIWQDLIPSGRSVFYDFGDITALPITFTHLASVTGVVTATMYSGI